MKKKVSSLLNLIKVICVFLIFVLSLLFFNVNCAFAHTPHDVIDKLEVSPNYEQDQSLLIIIRNNLLKSTNGGISWKKLVKGLDNKYSFSSIAIPSSGQLNEIFLSSNGDGIYKSQDQGNSWFKVNNKLGNLHIGLLGTSSDYAQDQVVFAAGIKKGLYKTKNGGKSWYQVIKGGNQITAINSFGDNKKHIVIGDNKGIVYLSTNGGEVWKKLFQIPNSGAITSVALSPQSFTDGTFFVGTEKSGVFKTVNNGISFIEVNNGISNKYITSLVISPNYVTDSTVFASTWHEAVFISNDGGTTWKKHSEGVTSDSQADTYKLPHFMDLRISKSFTKDKTIFLAGFDGLFKSTNSGDVWTEMVTLPLKLIMGLGLSPSYKDDFEVAITTYGGGVYLTDKQGNTWTINNKGLKETRLDNIVFSPSYRVDNTIFSASTNFFFKTTDGGNNWEEIKLKNDYWGLSKLIGAIWNRLLWFLPKWLITFVESNSSSPWPNNIAISPNFALDNTIYFEIIKSGIVKSIKSGNALNVWNAMGFKVNSIAISPDLLFDKTLYASVKGSKGVYKTVNGGETWQPASNGLAFIKEGIDLAISPDYKLDKTVFAGTLGGLYKTINAGKNWKKLVVANIKDGKIEAVAISPSYHTDKTIIISIRGKGLFKSVNGGESFTEVGKDLLEQNYLLSNMDKFPAPSVPIKFSPLYAIDNTIYGSSGEEFFKSTDGGNTWKIIKRPIRYEDNKRDYISYSKGWKYLYGNDFSANSISYSDSIDSKVTLNFIGTGVSWLGTNSNTQGIAKVYIDGNFKEYVDQFNDTRKVMVISYSVTNLAYGVHTITVEVTGTKNPQSTGKRVEIDGFDVF